MKRLVTPSLCALFALACAQEPGTVIYKGKTGELRIDHYANMTLDPATGGAKLTGSPVLVSWKDRGITISARQIETNAAIDDQTGNYFVQTGNLSGNVVFTQDSDVAYAYEVQRAKELGTQPQPITLPRTKASFSSQEMTYAGDANVGTLSIPNSFNETYSGHGAQSVKVGIDMLPREYDDTGEIHGSSGTIEFNVATGTASPLRKATVIGPITFKFARNGTLNGKAEPPILVSGVADRLDADFLGKEHTVTVTGNVQVQTELFTLSSSKQNPGVPVYQRATSSTGATKAVLFFGPKNELLRIEMEGTPTVTNIKPQRPVGGSS